MLAVSPGSEERTCGAKCRATTDTQLPPQDHVQQDASDCISVLVAASSAVWMHLWRAKGHIPTPVTQSRRLFVTA